MAWNTPIQATTNQVVTAAFWNAQIYDNFDAAYPDGVEWTDWTPTYANSSITEGNGTVTARYGRLGKWIALYYELLFGSSTALAAGTVQIIPPIGFSSNYTNNWRHPIGHGSAFESGAQQYPLGVTTGLNTPDDVINLFAINHSGTTYSHFHFISSSVPFTWGENDRLTLSALYETD